MWLEFIAWVGLAWYFFIALVCSIGCLQLFRNYSQQPKRARVSDPDLPQHEVPQATIIRPCKGLEPYLYECLASTFQQDYPRDKLTIHLCVSNREDAAYPILQRVLKDFPDHDARIFVEEDDHAIQIEGQLGPNPKIRNMSRAYREAKGDILWILDCNIWAGRGLLGRMVDKICGFGGERPYKFVHHVPVSIDVEVNEKAFPSHESNGATVESRRLGHRILPSHLRSPLSTAGGRLEELFLSSSHAKFYIAINTVAFAPCINGKSNMFRRSHLNYLTSPASAQDRVSPNPTTSELTTVGTNLPSQRNVGIDFFSHNICEDHLIGDLLWRGHIPFAPKNIGNHGLVMGDLALQPIANMSVWSYIARRVRWLRVRKFTVTLATLIEPGTESFLCSAFGAFGLATYCMRGSPCLPGLISLDWDYWWYVFAMAWVTSMVMWASIDWSVYKLLHSGNTVETEEGSEVPMFGRATRRPFSAWLLAWVGREALAFPVWFWAFWGGVTVVWRDRKFWVGLDMRVHEIEEKKTK